MGSRRDKLKRRVRKAVKWVGAGLTVLLLVVWIGSGWISIVRFNRFGGSSGVYSGRFVTLDVEATKQGIPVTWRRLPSFGFSLNLWFQIRTGTSVTMRSVPIWPAILMALAPTAIAWRTDAKYTRRARAGLCAGCGYDRAGLAAGCLCPECGKQPEAR